jgi:glucokinase
MILAGDIGGTSTRLGLFDPAPPRPGRRAFRVFDTLQFPALPAIIEAFFAAASIDPATVDRACFGVAGPVLDDAAALTNVPWRVEAREVAAVLKTPRVGLLNDLQAMAYAVPVLEQSELHTLQDGQADPKGNISLIAAGTGLGIALLHKIDGRLVPSPSEGGHADFAARTEREIALLRDLTRRFGRAEVEHVLSGPGLVNIHRVSHTDGCTGGVDRADADAPAAVTRAALARQCSGCVEALEIFVEAYGAHAGNLALGAVATGGVYVGGGIAPKILPALDDGRFITAFRSKKPFEGMLERIPVRVMMNADAGLLGAAVYAQTL